MEKANNTLVWFGILVLVLIFGVSSNAIAQLPSGCMPREKFEKLATENFKQKQIFNGITRGANSGKYLLFEVVLNENTGSFAVAQTFASDKYGIVTCVVLEGQGGTINKNPEFYIQPGQKG